MGTKCCTIKRKAIIDGVLQAFLLYAIGEYSVSVFATKLYAIDLIVIGLSSLASLVSYCVFSPKNKIVKFSLISSIIFMIAVCILHLSSLKVLPSRELSDADGFVIIVFVFSFFAVSFILRLLVFIVALIKTRIKDR